MIRSYKGTLKTQYNRLVRHAGLESEAVKSFILVCRANGNLYTNVLNLVSLYKQLCIPKNSERELELSFNPEMVDILKKATDSVVTNS